jgi:hydrogenase maturation factor HypF (carbamoyltransferase family)
MYIGKKSGVFFIVCVSVLFLIYYCEKTNFNVDVYAQVSENVSDNSTNLPQSANLTESQNVTPSNTNNAIPYVLNLTNGSDTTSQVVNQVIQAINGGQSTSLQQVLETASNGNSSTSLERVIDAASSALNNMSTSNHTNSTSKSTSGLS